MTAPCSSWARRSRRASTIIWPFSWKNRLPVRRNSRTLSPQTYINRVQKGGGMGFIAHPDHEGTALFHVKHYPWTDWSVTGYTGLGIWDFMTDWQKSLSGYLRAILSYVFPAFFLRGPSPKTLSRWDCSHTGAPRGRDRRTGQPRHLKRILGLNLSFLPFSRVFRLIRTHILTDGPLSGNSRADIATLFRRPEKRPSLCRPRLLPIIVRIFRAPDRGGTMGHDGR